MAAHNLMRRLRLHRGDVAVGARPGRIACEDASRHEGERRKVEVNELRKSRRAAKPGSTWTRLAAASAWPPIRPASRRRPAAPRDGDRRATGALSPRGPAWRFSSATPAHAGSVGVQPLKTLAAGESSTVKWCAAQSTTGGCACADVPIGAAICTTLPLCLTSARSAPCRPRRATDWPTGRSAQPSRSSSPSIEPISRAAALPLARLPAATLSPVRPSM